MILGSKAQTLKKIKLKKSIIPNLYLFKVSDYQKNSKKLLKLFSKIFKKKVAIRSSNISEDSKNKSFAGYFDSFLNIEASNPIDIDNSIRKVINSYKNYQSSQNEVFIQEMVEDVVLSGVCTTCDPRTLSPYTIIEFNKGKDTSIVTSGKSNTFTIKYIFPEKVKTKDNKIINLIKSIEEIKKIINEPNLEIEFAIDNKNIIYILQIRYVVLIGKNTNKINNNQLLISLYKLEKKITKLQKKHYEILGKTNYFGVMPDWNPAEIIGTKPKTLSLSLYQELITNSVWANQRYNYGYRNITSYHLMTTFFGTPFIDIRIDFNSWIPRTLDDEISEKLINFYLKKLKSNKQFHDKIEFEIIYSSYNFSTEKRIKELLNNGFTPKEVNKIIYGLKKVNYISINKISEDINKINLLSSRIDKITKSKLHPIDKIYWLLEDCKKYGTLPFAGLARCAFISIDILNSMVNEKIISEIDKKNFLENLTTITNEIKYDYIKLKKKKFLDKYGHLRPNTYEINSLNYRDGYDLYFQKNNKSNIKKFKRKKYLINLNKYQNNKLIKFINKNKLDLSVDEFFRFIKNSIEYREYSKFIFTKSVDEIFISIDQLGKKLKIKKNDLSYLNIQYLKELYFNLNNEDLRTEFKREIGKNKKQYIFNKQILLPDTIFDKKDIYFYLDNNTKINFITSKKITSSVIYLEKIEKRNFNKKIICIEQADPGFDFLFSYGIDGLITKYGGANSHMAIRCNELSIPAAIGVGEENFRKIINHSVISLDCETMKIDFVK